MRSSRASSNDGSRRSWWPRARNSSLACVLAADGCRARESLYARSTECRGASRRGRPHPRGGTPPAGQRRHPPSRHQRDTRSWLDRRPPPPVRQNSWPARRASAQTHGPGSGAERRRKARAAMDAVFGADNPRQYLRGLIAPCLEHRGTLTALQGMWPESAPPVSKSEGSHKAAGRVEQPGRAPGSGLPATAHTLPSSE